MDRTQEVRSSLQRDDAPTVYLAHIADSDSRKTLFNLQGVEAPSLLVSYAYATAWERVRQATPCRTWMLDSGAFTVRSTGKAIRLEEYIEYAKQRMADDPRLRDIAALDVIGDHHATMRNTEAMWEAGIPAVPCFHAGSPWRFLHDLKRFPKIAIGGAARAPYRQRDEFAREVFSRVWPARVHGFGYCAQRLVLAYPWHSVDASSWNNGMRFAQWWSMASRGAMKGGRTGRVADAGAHLHCEIEYFARLERAARSKWRRAWNQSAQSC